MRPITKFLCLCVAAAAFIPIHSPSVADEGSFDEISDLIRQKKGKEARRIINERLKSPPDDETTFRLLALRAESLIADESLSAADDFADLRARFNKIDRRKHKGEFDGLQEKLNALAMSNFLKAVSMDERHQTREAADLWQTTKDKLEPFLDDRGRLAEKIAHCRLLINYDHERMASIILRGEIDDIPDLVKKYRETLKQDELLNRCILAAYFAMIRASVRMDDFHGAERVKKKMFSVINVKLQPVIDEWIDSEIARRKVLHSVLPAIRPVLKRAVDAINADRADDLQSCVWPGSALYASSPGILKSAEIVIYECKPMDVSIRTSAAETPQENDRIWLWVYLSKTLIYKKDKEQFDQTTPDRRMSVPKYVIDGPEWAAFRFDGREWKIEQFNFGEIPLTSLSFGKEKVRIR